MTSDSNENGTQTTRKGMVDDFNNLNEILNSLVDFIRPETFIAQDELENYHELKEKLFRLSNQKKKKSNSKQTEMTDFQSIRNNSGIYRFLAKHQKTNPSGKKKSTVSREDLLKKLHEKMPHHQEKSDSSDGKRKRDKDKSQEKVKKIRTVIPQTPSISKDAKPKLNDSTNNIVSQITYGRFDFNTDEVPTEKSKRKLSKKPQSKEKQLKNTLKQLEEEQEEIKRLGAQDPDQSEQIVRSKHWKTALAKAKGEKVRDNPQMLRKTIKKEQKRREKSAKKWNENKKQTEKRIKERQEKRRTNLEKRKEQKKAKIKKKLIKKGRLIS